MSKSEQWPDRREIDTRVSQLPVSERRSGDDRRRADRIRLTLETAVPVIVRSEGLVQWGVARNISEGGMLIEMTDAPSMGARVEVKLMGIHGSTDSPAPAVLTGEVRHQVAWNFGDRGLSAVGVRFVDAPPPPEHTGLMH